MQPLRYDSRSPAAKDNSITHAAKAGSNLDAATQRHILFRKYLCRTYPLQELSLETISFAETVFANLILYRNCLCRPYPLQELPLQIKFFTQKNFLFTLQSFKKLILGNHNLSGKASLQLHFSGKHSSRYLNILHKFHFGTFSNFL